MKSSANQRPSLLRADSPEREKERKRERGEIIPSIMATSLRWRMHSARTNIYFKTGKKNNNSFKKYREFGHHSNLITQLLKRVQ